MPHDSIARMRAAHAAFDEAIEAGRRLSRDEISQVEHDAILGRVRPLFGPTWLTPEEAAEIAARMKAKEGDDAAQ